MSCERAECRHAYNQVERLRAALRKALGALHSLHKTHWEVRVALNELEERLDEGGPPP